MPFSDLKKDELIEAASHFGVDVDRSERKQQIIDALEENGVDFALYLDQFPEKAEELSEVPDDVSREPVIKPAQVEDKDGKKILIKMTRGNPYYEVGKRRFTTAHPYQLVSEAEANRILTTLDGFRQATPGELQEYYS